MRKTVTNLARKVGQILLKEFQKSGRSGYQDKYKHEIVTKFDFLSEKMILKELRRHYPDHSILSEETHNKTKGKGYIWVVDPIDGTTNFVMKNPLFSVSIGLVKDGQPVFGVIYAPVTDEMFVGEKAKGATLNNRKIKVNNNSRTDQAFLTFCHGTRFAAIKEAIELYRTLKLKGKDFRQLGSAALECAFVASGRSGAIMIPGVHAWDVAAGAVIVREASGRVTDFQNKDWTIKSKNILATNGAIHKNLLRYINEVYR